MRFQDIVSQTLKKHFYYYGKIVTYTYFWSKIWRESNIKFNSISDNVV